MEEANLSYVDNTSPLMIGVLNNSQVWMSHGDTISDLPEGFNYCWYKRCKSCAYKIQDETTYTSDNFIQKYIIQQMENKF